MTAAILLSLLTGLLWAGVGDLFSRAPKENDPLTGFFAWNSIINLIFALLCCHPQWVPAKELGLLALLMIPAAILELLGFWLLKVAMSCGNQGISWAVLQSSMVIPFLGSLLLPGTRAHWPAFAGLALLLGGLALLGADKKSTGGGSRKGLYALLTAFLLVGLSQFLKLLPNYVSVSEAALNWRLILSSLTGVIWWNALILFRRKNCWKGVWKNALLYGLVVALGQYVFYRAADAAHLCSWTHAVYPTAVGGCIILFSLDCVFLKKEKLSLLGWLGVLGIVFGIAGLSLR